MESIDILKTHFGCIMVESFTFQSIWVWNWISVTMMIHTLSDIDLSNTWLQQYRVVNIQKYLTYIISILC